MRPKCLIPSLALLTLLASPLSAQQEREFNLRTAGVADIQDAVAAGALTYERLVQLYLNRIEAYDQQGPALNAILEINPRALQIARALDDERRSSGPLRECIEASERENLWLTARDLLSADAYAAMWLRYVEDLPVREVANALERPISWTKVTLMRARNALEQEMHRQTPEEREGYG